MRIEGSHEVVELVPGRRSADPDPDSYMYDPGTDADAGPDDDVDDLYADGRLARLWRAGSAAPRARLTRAWTWLVGTPAVRPLAAAVTRAAAKVPARAKVVFALLAIAAAGFAVIGVAGVSVLRGYADDRADTQLREASAQLRLGPRWFQPPDFQPGDVERRPIYFFDRLPQGVAAQLITDGGTEHREFGSTLWNGPSGPAIPDRLSDHVGRPFTVPARGTGTHWRVLVTEPFDDTTLIVATDLGAADAATGRLTEITLLAGAIVLAAMGYIGFRVVRTGAAPLTEIERTVEAAVAGDLSRRVPVPARDAEPAQVANAVNTLIDKIDDARRAEEHTRHTVDEAGRAVRQRLNFIQGFTEFYRERPGHDAARMARLVDRVGDEAARIQVVLEDLVADLSRAGNGSNGSNGSNGAGGPDGAGGANGNGAGTAANGTAANGTAANGTRREHGTDNRPD